MAKALNHIAPSISLASELNTKHLCRDRQVVQEYENDPLVHDRISFALFKGLYFNGLKLLTEDKKAKIPVLICHGDADKITSFHASNNYAENLGEKAIFKSWTESYHEPHHDKDKQQVMNFYADWVLEKLPVLKEGQ